MENIYVLVGVFSTLLALRAVRNRRNRRRPRRFWMRNWFLRREQKGLMRDVENELKVEDDFYYRRFMRMQEAEFEYIFSMIAEDIMKQDTRLRKSIDARQRLSTTLRFLATGESFESLGLSCRIAPVTVGRIVRETMSAIITRLGPIHLKVPTTVEEWEDVAKGFQERWNFPNCLGALDGKHIAFKSLRTEGAYYYCYKGFNSLVLLALVDSEKKFLFVDIGANGRVSDGGVFARSELYRAICTNCWNFPQPRPLPGRRRKTPFVIIADNAFPLLLNLIKPYVIKGLTQSQLIYNKWLSSARNVVENAFGILAQRFRIFMTTIQITDPTVVEQIIHSCVILHNILMERNPQHYDLQDDEQPVVLPDFEEVQGTAMTRGTAVRLEYLRCAIQT